MARPIRWDLIAQQYDPMVKYATAIRLGTASTEAILRRFTRDVTHPAYSGMLELGRAQRTIFLARWLRDRDLQRETTAGLNTVEDYNGVNDYIHFGKSGEFATNRREEMERGDAVPPDLPVLPRVRVHPHDAGHTRRARVVRRPR